MIHPTSIRCDLWSVMVLDELVEQRTLIDDQYALASQAAQYSTAMSHTLVQIREAQRELGGYIAKCCPDKFC